MALPGDRENRGDVSIRVMSAADIADGLRLCRASRWNQTQRDWEFLLERSPDGCRAAIKADRVVGTVTTIRYEDRFSWIGMLLVDPAERGRGVGTRLLSAAMDALRDMPSVKLDATPAGHAVYCKLDFADEYGLTRMSRDASIVAPHRGGARRMTRDDLPAVAALDREVFGADRRATLDWMLDGAPAYAWIVEARGGVAGYMLGRHGFDFEQLGPIVARTEDSARQLVLAGMSAHAGRPMIVDAAHHDPEWRPWLASVGFREQRPFIRMFRRSNPSPGVPAHQFGILGPEFG